MQFSKVKKTFRFETVGVYFLHICLPATFLLPVVIPSSNLSLRRSR